MADNLCELAEDVKYKNEIKEKQTNKLVSYVHESIAKRITLDLRRTDIKQQNKNFINLDLLSFVFEHVNKYTTETRSKTNVFEWYTL